MSRPVPGSPQVTILLEQLLPGGAEDPHGDGSLGATCGPSGLLPRRTLQAALRVKRFYREHAQLFRWICIGLLCTGELGPTHSSHLHPSHPCLRAGSFTYPVSQQSFVEQQLKAEHARSRASRIKADQMLFPRPDVDQLGRGQQLCPHSAACHLGAPRKDGVIREDFQEEVAFESHRLSRSWLGGGEGQQGVRGTPCRGTPGAKVKRDRMRTGS